MTRILIFTHTLIPLSETFVYQQAKGVAQQHDVEFMAFEFINDDKFPITEPKHQLKKMGLPTRIVRSVMRRAFGFDFNLNIGSFLRSRRVLKTRGISLVHAHFGWAAITLLRVAKKCRVPLAVSFHGFDASASVRDPIYASRLPGLFEYASAVIVCSRHMIANLGLQKWIHKVHIIPYGVNAETFRPQQHSPSPVLRIVHSGRMVAKKGVPDLIRAFARLARERDNIILELLGGGTELELCKKVVEELQVVDKVVFHGPRPHSYVKELMGAADIFVLNSRTDEVGDMEGLPVSLLEAMSLERAVISTYHAGIPDAITNGDTGLLVPERSNDALYEAMAKLAADPELRVRLGKNARAAVLASFEEKIMISRIQGVLASLVK